MQRSCRTPSVGCSIVTIGIMAARPSVACPRSGPSRTATCTPGQPRSRSSGETIIEDPQPNLNLSGGLLAAHTSGVTNLKHTLTLADMVEQALGRYRQRIALVDGQRRLTFAELEARSGRLANALLALSGGTSTRVGILLPNCLEYVETDLAVLRAGLTKVPINTRLSDDEKLHILVDSAAEILVELPRFGGR